MPADAVIRSICEEIAPRAPAMIVTVYGDFVMPHGSVMGMAALIALCGELGFSESLVRTAVSRLVAAGRLEGERRGRRSYYRLTVSAHREFSAVAQQLHHPEPAPTRWAIHMSPSTSGLSAASPGRFGRLAGDLFLAPDGDDAKIEAQLTFKIASVSDRKALRDLAASIWPLDDLAAGYRGFIRRFEALPAGGTGMTARQALLLRLLLVHEFRRLLLSDPRLPDDALPECWRGGRARALFERLHRELSTLAAGEGTHLLSGLPTTGPAGESGNRTVTA